MGAASFTIQQPETILAPCSKCGKGIVVWEARALSADSTHWPKKRAGSESLPSQPSGLYVLRQLSTHNGSNDDGGGGSSDAHHTSSMRGPCNSHSTDIVGSIHTDNSQIRNPESQFPQKSERH